MTYVVAYEFSFHIMTFVSDHMPLSPSTAVYIPIDVCCTYVSTSYIPSTSSTSRVSSGYGDGTSGILAGRRCEL